MVPDRDGPRGGRVTLQEQLDPDHVAELVLDRPAGALGREVERTRRRARRRARRARTRPRQAVDGGVGARRAHGPEGTGTRRSGPTRAPLGSVGHGGTPTGPPGGGTMATYDGYCVKCREKRDFEGQEVELANGRRAAQGSVPGLRDEDQPHPRQEVGVAGGPRRYDCGPVAPRRARAAGRGAVWQRACFGSTRPPVRIRAPRRERGPRPPGPRRRVVTVAPCT